MRLRPLFLIVMLLCWFSPAEAKITFGVVPNATRFFPSLSQARDLAAYLEKRLGEEVTVRDFQNVAELHEWLNRFRAVDIAVFTVGYIRQQPAGEFQVLATVIPQGTPADQAAELVVAQHGVRRGLRNRLEVVLTAMGGDPEGRRLLANSGISHLVGAKIAMPVNLAADSPPPVVASPPATDVESPAEAVPPLPSSPTPVDSFVTAESAQPSAPAEPVPAIVAPPPPSAVPVVTPAADIAATRTETAPVAETAKATAVSTAKGGGLQDLGGPAPVNLEADELSYDQEASAYQAHGDVRLIKGAVTLDADHLLFNEGTGAANATGNVYLIDPTGNLRADQLDYNLETGLGRVTDGKVFMKEHNFHLAGAELEKVGEQSYLVEKGFFTTCDGEIPSWKFGAKHIDVTLGKYARARNVLFYLHDIPVLYLPYVVFPAKTERESGLLMPRFGYSEKRGAELSLAYYQVIARNQDATLYLDYLSDFGIGQGAEYRYVFGADNEGTLRGYYVNNIRDEYLRERLQDEPELEDTLDEDDRYALEWNHLGTLPGDWTLSADVEYVSNRDYFDEFGTVAEEYTKDQSESVVFLSRAWENNILAAEFDYTQELEFEDDTTLQRLPQIRFDALRRRLGETPFFFSLGSTYTYFWREEEVEAASKIKGQRLNARPALAAFFTPLPWLEVMPEIGYRERLYQTSAAGPGYEEEGLYDFSTRFGTSFSRVFNGGLGSYRKIRHSIDPEVIYSYIPDEPQDHLPSFDSLDRINAENRVTYALTNRLTARLEPQPGMTEYLEFLYFRLSQSYDIRQSRHDREDLDGQDPFADVRGELILAPTRSTLVDFDTRYNFHSRVLDTFNARTALYDQGGNKISANYRYSRAGTEYSTDGLEYVSGAIDLTWLAPFYLGYEHRYDVRDQTSLEKVFDLEYRAQCWSLFLTLRDRLDDRQYVLVFALSGLGNVMRMGGNLGNKESSSE